MRFLVMTCAFLFGTRSATAFNAHRLFTSSTTASFRRKRPDRSGTSGMALIEKLQQEGRVSGNNFRYGHFVQASAEGTAAATLSTTVVNFPLKGKQPEDQPPRMRFAPSPTGSLHVGGARTALYNWLVAKKGQLDFPKSNAAFVLRVEDTDVARSTKESEDSVLADLQWLGLLWDEGPDMDKECGPYRQSERGDIYIEIANQLLAQGKAYRCFCTTEELEEMKQEQEARGETPRYDGRWRDADQALIDENLAQGKPFTIRFKVPDNARVVIEDVVRGTVAWDAQATVGDFILLRSTGVPVYNFCVAVDDAAMGITTVVRAEEHLTNTVRQALVLDALSVPRPRYAHCSLILGEDKQKLSKRHGATSCDQYRLDGFLPDAMINYLALLGWNDGSDNEIFTREELIDAFALERVVKSPSVFDVEKLRWVNSQHMKMMSVEQLIPFVKHQFEVERMIREGANEAKVLDFCYASTSLAKQMMMTTKDAALNAKTVLGYGLPSSFDQISDSEVKTMIEHGYFYPLAKRVVEQVRSGDFPKPDQSNPLAAFQDASGQAIEEDSQKGAACSYTTDYMAHMKTLSKEIGAKGKHFFHPLRLALTGEMSGQDVTKQLSLLALATGEGSVIDTGSLDVVSFDERIERLSAFIETIPASYREPQTQESHASTKDEQVSKSVATAAKDTKTVPDASSSSSSTSLGASDPKDSYEGTPISALDIRVGLITKVWEHPEADKLYCEEIDVGEGTVRQVASGLRPYMTAEELEGRKVLVLCNLKERKLVGFPSHGMVLCASNADHTVVKLVNPPVDAPVGERVTFPDFDMEDPYPENKVGKKKIVEELAPFLKTNQYGVPEFLSRPWMTSAGVCTSSIADGSVS